MSALGGLSAAILPPELGGPDPAAMELLLASHLSRMPPLTRAGVRIGATALDWTARVRTGHSLRALEPDRRASLLRDGAGPSDEQLVGCFVEQGDQATFAVLVRRPGPMVWLNQ